MRIMARKALGFDLFQVFIQVSHKDQYLDPFLCHKWLINLLGLVWGFVFLQNIDCVLTRSKP
jgi:hypothetical protein